MNAPSVLARVRQHLVQLKLACSLEVLDDTMSRVEQGKLSVLEAIDVLLSDECANRETRRIKAARMSGRLTQIKTLESFDFSFQPSLDRNRILTLAQLGFIERNQGATYHRKDRPYLLCQHVVISSAGTEHRPRTADAARIGSIWENGLIGFIDRI